MTPLVYKKNRAARRRFAKLHLNKPQNFWTKSLGPKTLVSKFKSFPRYTQGYISHAVKTNTACQCKHFIPAFERGVGGAVMWTADTGPGCIAPTELTWECPRVERESICLTVKARLKLGREVRWSSPAHTHTDLQHNVWGRDKKKYQSPESDLNSTEVLWQDLKRAVHKQKPTNCKELKSDYKEKWAEIPSQQCERLIMSWRKH